MLPSPTEGGIPRGDPWEFQRGSPGVNSPGEDPWGGILGGSLGRSLGRSLERSLGVGSVGWIGVVSPWDGGSLGMILRESLGGFALGATLGGSLGEINVGEPWEDLPGWNPKGSLWVDPWGDPWVDL